MSIQMLIVEVSSAPGAMARPTRTDAAIPIRARRIIKAVGSRRPAADLMGYLLRSKYRNPGSFEYGTERPWKPSFSVSIASLET
jgi:hypothetical protein